MYARTLTAGGSAGPFQGLAPAWGQSPEAPAPIGEAVCVVTERAWTALAVLGFK